MSVPALRDPTYRLEDRYERETGRIYATGTQALVRMMLAQAAQDRRNGLNTAGFVAGYRGSPLGAVDQELWKAKKQLEQAKIKFQPAINEDLAATMVLGTQQVETEGRANVDGVFAMWYGKGPGVDRSGDALKHGNAYGSSPRGGALIIAGDDHGCVSSSMSHQSDTAFVAWSMPILNPASIGEYVAFGLYGWALSRFSGTWVGFKAISETVEGAGSFELPPMPDFVTPADFETPASGLHYRWNDLPGPGIEQRLLPKLEAVRAFARANPIDRVVVRAERPRIGIVTAGKAYSDLMEVFRLAGLDHASLAAAGVSVLKLGLTFPIEPVGMRAFCEGLEEVLVVEEKAAVIEPQLKELLFNLAVRPLITGKTDESGCALIATHSETRPSRLAPIVAARLSRLGLRFDAALALAEPVVAVAGAPVRKPYFCSGCPHNRSTNVPEGSKALAGIGCHFMASWMERDTGGLTQMGGEGVNWIGLSPYSDTKHVYQNLGDGTFFHSGHMALRQAIAADATVTYKILFNDAVAMTGGQPVDGTLTVPQISRMVAAEGVKRIAVVVDDPAKYPADYVFAPGTTIHPRDDLDLVQRQLREEPGVTVLIYDQTCAAEKRRRRKRGTFPDPSTRAFINEAVCEGCGDCGKKSNCLSILPLDTELGRKRQIDQSSCNKDYSCVDGFCPSFVTVTGGKPRKGQGAGVASDQLSQRIAALPLPVIPGVEAEPYELLVAGVGGTGVVTVGALICMAAHLEGRAVSVLDFMGFAQKGGAVLSHVRIAAKQDDLHQTRIDLGGAHAVLACDLVVATSGDAIGVTRRERTRIVANLHESPTGDFARDANAVIDVRLLERRLRQRVGDAAMLTLDAHELARQLIGDPIAANVLLMGFAWQSGLVPVSLAALDRAIELNGAAISSNRLAFAWGRLAAADPAFVAERLAPTVKVAETLEEIVAFRRTFLTGYQNAAYAERYADRVEQVRELEQSRIGSSGRLTEAVARNLFKLMAYKDEYEVARLYAEPAFRQRLAQNFEGDVKLKVHLAPPGIARKKGPNGEPKKIAFGAWILPVFGVLRSLKFLRGTALDPFGRTVERRHERGLIADYETLLDGLQAQLTPATLQTAIELAELPDQIRGFGPVKERSMEAAALRRAALLAKLQPAQQASRAA